MSWTAPRSGGYAPEGESPEGQPVPPSGAATVRDEVWVVRFENGWDTRSIFVYRDADSARAFADRIWSQRGRSADPVSWQWIESMARWELVRDRYRVAEITVEREPLS